MPDLKFHVVYAHPYPTQSNATQGLLKVFRQRSDVSVHSIYDLYPDGDIDIEAEQAALLTAPNIVWLTPVYWYSVPGLMKQWFDQVLARGWAYGQDQAALRGRRCWWVATTGGDEFAYSADGMHQRPFADFIAPVEQTALFCGMDWQAPFIVHGAYQLGAVERAATVLTLSERIEQLASIDGAA